MDSLNTVAKTQVVIVGAGPTGLSMAVQLLRYGIDFIIIEKNEAVTPLSKALVIQARTLEIFEELGIAEKAIEEGQVTTAVNLFYKGKQKAAVNFTGLGKGLSPFPFVLSLEQSKTEKLLVDYLSDNIKEIQWKCAFSHFIQDDNGITVYYKNPDGQEQEIRSEYLVGCDGASSAIRHEMGLSFEGDTVPKIFYVTDVKLISPVINRNELFMFMIKKGFVLFFPMEGEGHYRVIGILPDGKGLSDQFAFDDIENTIKQHVNVPLDFVEVLWFSSYKVHSRKANSFENNRAYIAGDAAHIHTPAGGQGMNTGIQDAYNLAWKMAYKIKGEVGNNVLKTYSTERMENAKKLLRTTDRIFDIMAGTNPFWNFVRLNFVTPILGFVTKNARLNKFIFPLISQTAITYEGSSLTIDSSIGKVKAGVRMPFFTFSNGKLIFEFLAEPFFKILFFGSKEANAEEQLSNIMIKVVSHYFEEIPPSLFGNEKNFYILLRPDNHISYIGKDFNECSKLLKRISHLN